MFRRLGCLHEASWVEDEIDIRKQRGKEGVMGAFTMPHYDCTKRRTKNKALRERAQCAVVQRKQKVRRGLNHGGGGGLQLIK